MIEIFDDVVQGSADWRELRLGIPTASCFSDILAKGQGKSRRTYRNRLIAELLTGKPQDTYSNDHMARGRELEAEAREIYSLGRQVRQVGFVRNGQVGCSPDALVGDDGMLEIKTRLPHLMVELYETGNAPSEYQAQIQGSLWVCERQWCDLVCYAPELPWWSKRIERDEKFIANLASEVEAFLEELNATFAKVAA